MVEGSSASATNYYTVSLHNQCIVIMFDIDRQYVNLVLEQWDSFDASLMLADHINETDFTVEQRGRSVKFYGCAAGYRGMFLVRPEITCGKRSLRTLVSFRKMVRELPKPYSFQNDVIFQEVGHKTPIGKISPGFYATLLRESASTRIVCKSAVVIAIVFIVTFICGI